ncbi:hypothetical protein KSS87_013213 [Heliosperma pusillum]|nr:hypothetical protein KSS87_013213 [Heliosperma pusillum]
MQQRVMKQGRLIAHTKSYNVTTIVHTRKYNANNG